MCCFCGLMINIHIKAGKIEIENINDNNYHYNDGALISTKSSQLPQLSGMW